MAILPFPCAVPGCKKSKLNKHTHFIGDISRTGADTRMIADMIAFAQMRGEPVPQIPGGSKDDMNLFLKGQVKQGNKEAKEFRKRVSRELDEQKKRGEKPDKKKAEAAAKKKR